MSCYQILLWCKGVGKLYSQAEMEAAAKKARQQAEDELAEDAEVDRAAKVASSLRKEVTPPKGMGLDQAAAQVPPLTPTVSGLRLNGSHSGLRTEKCVLPHIPWSPEMITQQRCNLGFKAQRLVFVETPRQSESDPIVACVHISL